MSRLEFLLASGSPEGIPTEDRGNLLCEARFDLTQDDEYSYAPDPDTLRYAISDDVGRTLYTELTSPQALDTIVWARILQYVSEGQAA